jgi:hypothetical protein
MDGTMDELVDLQEFFATDQDPNQPIENIKFKVSTRYNQPLPYIFINCDFIFSSNSAATFQKHAFNNCKFIGIFSNVKFKKEGPHRKLLLSFSNCTLTSSSLINYFGQINIVSTEVDCLTDLSETNVFQTNSCEITNSKISGICNTLQLDSTRVTKSSEAKNHLTSLFDKISWSKKETLPCFWDKEVTQTAIFRSAIFDKTSLNPYYFSTKCKDKSTLDLSGAIFIDDWSKLRKKYSGLSLFIVFLLTITFFLPFVFETIGLLISTKLTNLSMSKFAEIPTTPLWQLLFFGGREGTAKLVYCATTSLLVLYNITRLLLTISIAKLREEEQFLSDAGFQSVSPHPNKYTYHKKVDKYLTIVFWFALLISIYKTYDAFLVQVPVLKDLF